MTSGLIERLSRHSRALIESDYLLQMDQDRDCSLLINSYDLLGRIGNQLKRPNVGQTITTITPDTEGIEQSSSVARAHFLNQLETSEAAGSIGSLYATVALTNSSTTATGSCSNNSQKLTGSSSNSPTPSQQFGLSINARALTYSGLKLLRSIAELDLNKFQVRNIIIQRKRVNFRTRGFFFFF